MTLILNGTDNSATTPAVTGTDTDTGVYYPAANQVAIATSGTQAMLANASQGVQFANAIGVGATTPTTSGAGITFPATQSASSDANTLDDYEEGSWTPTLSFSSGSILYQDRVGQYTKVGNLVTVSFWVRVGTTSSPSGVLSISGLPFNSNGTQSRPAVLFRARSLSGVTGVIGAWLGTSSSSLTVEIQNNGSGSDLNANTLVNNSELDAFFSYHV